MIFSILRTIAIGVMAGFALFVLPFILMKVLFFALIVGAAMRLFRGRRSRNLWHRMPYRPMYVDDLREETIEGQWSYPSMRTQRPAKGQTIIID